MGCAWDGARHAQHAAQPHTHQRRGSKRAAGQGVHGGCVGGLAPAARPARRRRVRRRQSSRRRECPRINCRRQPRQRHQAGIGKGVRRFGHMSGSVAPQTLPQQPAAAAAAAGSSSPRLHQLQSDAAVAHHRHAARRGQLACEASHTVRVSNRQHPPPQLLQLPRARLPALLRGDKSGRWQLLGRRACTDAQPVV